MKVKSGEFARRAPQLARDCRLFFLCGPDEGGASAAADKLIAALPDAGERIEFSGSEVKSDPVRIADEAVSSSLFGGSRHLYLRVTGDEAKDALELMLDQEEGAAPVVIVARSATDKSRTAKLIEKRADGVVTMFYPPDLRSLAGEVRQMADAAGLRLPTALAERIAGAVRLDARLARSEVEKLALYLDASPQSPKSVDEADYDAVCAASEDDGFNPLVTAVLSGKTDRLAHELERYLGVVPSSTDRHERGRRAARLRAPRGAARPTGLAARPAPVDPRLHRGRKPGAAGVLEGQGRADRPAITLARPRARPAGGADDGTAPAIARAQPGW